MTQGTQAPAVHVHAEVPSRWQRCADEGQTLTFAGPSDGGVRATVRVETTADADTIDGAAASVAERLRTRHPNTLLISSDIWPHPTLGEGRFLQSARIDDGVALAHDVYVFVGDGVRVEIAVQCALADLLDLEEEVATIVARVRLGAGETR